MSNRVVPYPGLRPFGETDRAIFFGREAQTVSVLSLLQENQFVAVVGSSGSGKSSLILAGLLPAVREGFLRSTREWKIVVLKPGSDPCGNLARALTHEGLGEEHARPGQASAESDSEEKRQPDSGLMIAPAASVAENGAQTLLEKLHATDRALLDVITPPSRASEASWAERQARGELAVSTAVTFAPPEEPGGPRVLIVVDQFEELFTFRRAEAETGSKTARFAPRDEAATFVRLLLSACLDPGGRIAVIITMRSDFIGDCDAFLELPELVSQCQFLVPRLNRSQMREAIERPGQIDDLGYALFGFEEGLVNRIIAEAGDRIDQLPLMQHALMRTWKEAGGPEAPAGSSITLTATHYKTAGRITGALSKHADLAWLTIKDDPVKAHLARQLFLLLSDVHPDGKIVRRRPLLAEVRAVTGADTAAIEKIVRLFQSDDRNFLLPPLEEEEHLPEDGHLDISHEALLRQWTEFGKWLAQEAEWKIWLLELSQAAKDYEIDPTTELWHGNDLRGAEDWMKQVQPSEAWARRHGVRNWQPCLAFLDRSRSEAARLEEKEREITRQRQADEERHQKILLTLSYIIAAVLLLFGGTMTYFWIRAQKSETRSRETIDLFGKTADVVVRPINAYAASALGRAEQQVGKLKENLADSRTGAAPPDPAVVDELLRAQNGAETAADAIEKFISLQKAAIDITRDTNLQRKADLLIDQAREIRQRRDALQRNPEILAIIKSNFAIRLARIEQDLSGFLGVEKPDRALALSRQNDIAHANAEVNAILAMGRASDALGFKEEDYADFSKRAEPIMGTLDRLREITEAASNGPQVPILKTDAAVLLLHEGKVNRVRFSPLPFNNAPLIASAGEDKTVRLWDMSGKILASKTISSPINDIAFSPQADALAAASNGSTVRVFRWSPGALNTAAITETSFERHADSITDVEFSRGGERIVSSSADRTVRVFNSTSMAQLYFTSPSLPGIVTSVAFHRGGNLVVSGCDDGGVRLHTIVEPRSVQLLGTFDAPARRPEFSSDGILIIAASGDKTARVWKTVERSEIVRVNHTAPLTQATFRPVLDAKGYVFVTTATNGEIRLVQFSDLTTQSADYPGKILDRRHPGVAVFATWSGDGRWLATVGGGEVLLWEWTNETLTVRLRIAELNLGTSRAEFSPDAKLLVTYGGDQVAYIWDLTKFTAAP